MSDSHNESVRQLELKRLLKEMADLIPPESQWRTPPPAKKPTASSDWKTRKHLHGEKWRAEKSRLVNIVLAKENVAGHICDQCAVNPAAVRCHGCQPRAFFCAQCDINTHSDSRYVLHNRDAMTAGFFQPVPPTTCIVDKAPCRCGKFLFAAVHVT